MLVLYLGRESEGSESAALEVTWGQTCLCEVSLAEPAAASGGAGMTQLGSCSTGHIGLLRTS